MTGLKAKLHHKQRHAEKREMRRTMKMLEKRNTKQQDEAKTPQGEVPACLLDREGQSQARVLSNMVKQNRKEKAGKWEVPWPNVCAQGERKYSKLFERKGERKTTASKRTVTEVCFAGDALLKNYLM